MACYHPITGYRSKSKNSNGLRPIVFSVADGDVDLPVRLPCGKCIGCRVDRAKQWATRCVHEAKLHDDNCFITLTYDDEHVDKHYSLVKEDFVKFMKRLRKKYGPKIRFFHCGEYGENFDRPHHHSCIFNFRFPDEKIIRKCQGYNLYDSESLSKLWGNGFCSIGDVTYESARYVAQYCIKKINGPRAAEHYQGRTPEYVTMSRRPGIGADWIKKFTDDVYVDDRVIIRDGVSVKPPRYYDKLFDKINHRYFERVKRIRQGGYHEILSARVNKIYGPPENSTPERLAVRERLQLRKQKQQKRNKIEDFIV